MDDLEKSDVTEIRSFAKPPPEVQGVCECIVILKGYKEKSWSVAKGMMADTNFLSSLKNMDVDGIGHGQVSCTMVTITMATIAVVVIFIMVIINMVPVLWYMYSTLMLYTVQMNA